MSGKVKDKRLLGHLNTSLIALQDATARLSQTGVVPGLQSDRTKAGLPFTVTPTPLSCADILAFGELGGPTIQNTQPAASPGTRFRQNVRNGRTFRKRQFAC